MFSTTIQTPNATQPAPVVSTKTATSSPVNVLVVTPSPIEIMPIETPAPARRGILEQRRRRARRLAARH